MMWIRRAGATLVDVLILSVVAFGLGVILSGHPYIGLIIDFVLTGAYLVLFLTQSHGQTPGNRAAQTQVRLASSGGTLSTRTALIRFLAQWLPTYASLLVGSPALFSVSGAYVLIDILMPIWDSKGQTIHDKIAGTMVISAPGQFL
jgi:uncharacterized RDD family membrane protein YckC